MTPTELKRIRKRLGFTQGDLAACLGVGRVTVTRWEVGSRRISELAARLIQRIVEDARGKAKRKK